MSWKAFFTLIISVLFGGLLGAVYEDTNDTVCAIVFGTVAILSIATCAGLFIGCFG